MFTNDFHSEDYLKFNLLQSCDNNVKVESTVLILDFILYLGICANTGSRYLEVSYISITQYSIGK